jgi:hypothetical protein
LLAARTTAEGVGGTLITWQAALRIRVGVTVTVTVRVTVTVTVTVRARARARARVRFRVRVRVRVRVGVSRSQGARVAGRAECSKGVLLRYSLRVTPLL